MTTKQDLLDATALVNQHIESADYHMNLALVALDDLEAKINAFECDSGDSPSTPPPVTPVTISFLGSQIIANDSAQTSFSLGAFNAGSNGLGTQKTGRQIVVAVHWIAPTASVAPTGLTVAGASATEISSSAIGTGNVGVKLYKLANNSAAGNIGVTFNGTGAARCAVYVYAVYDADVTLCATATPDTTLTGEKLSTTLNVPAQGAVIAAAFGRSGSGSPTWTWGNITESAEKNCGGIYAAYGSTAAMCESATAITPLTVENTQTGPASAANNQGLIAVSFKPL